MKNTTIPLTKQPSPFIPSWVFQGLFYACVLSLALGQLGRFDTTWGGIYLHDILITSWLFLLLVTGELHTALYKTTNPWQKYRHLLLFFCWVCLGWGWNSLHQGQLPLRGIFYACRLIIYGWWGLLLAPKYISKASIYQSLLLIQTVNVLFGLGFFFLMPDTRFLAILGWDDHYFRLLGVHLDPNITGLHLVLLWTGLAFCLFNAPKLVTEKVTKIVFSILLGLTSLAIVLTFSRAAYLTWVVSLVGITGYGVTTKFTNKVNRIFAGVVLFLFLSLGVLISTTTSSNLEGQNLWRTASIKARLAATQTYLTSIKREAWLVGNGLFTPQPSQLHADNRAFLPDSWPITLLAGTGIVGLVLWLILIGKYTQLAKLPLTERRLLQLLILIALFHALSINSLFYGFTWLEFSLLIGATQTKV